MLEKLRFGRAISLDDSSRYTGQESSSSETNTLDQGPDGKAEGPKNGLNKAEDLKESVERQQGMGELSEDQSQRARKRKIDSTGSVNKRSRFAMGKREGIERDDTGPPSSSFTESSCYPEDEDTQAGETQTEHGQAMMGKKEESERGNTGPPSSPFTESSYYPEDEDTQAGKTQTEDDQANNTQVLARTLPRSMDAEIDKAARTVKRLLSQKKQSLFVRYIEFFGGKVRGKGNPSPQYTGNYYQKMATESFRMLRQQKFGVTKKELSDKQAKDIIEELFVNTFPKLFTTLVDALASVQKARKLENATTPASPPRQEVSIPQGVREVQEILHEIERLETQVENLTSQKLKAKMRQLRLLVQLRTVHKAVMNPNRDISSVDPNLQPIITHIRKYASTTSEQSVTKVTQAKSSLASLLFPGDPQASVTKKKTLLDKCMKNSNVIFSMTEAFSIGCIWMDPTLQSRVWNGHTSSLDQIFNIVKECDSDGRVYNICQSLERLTLAYTEAESSLGNVDTDVLDDLEAFPLSCMIRLIAQEAGVSADSGGGQGFD